MLKKILNPAYSETLLTVNVIAALAYMFTSNPLACVVMVVTAVWYILMYLKGTQF